jgi:hypothetical protein
MPNMPTERNLFNADHSAGKGDKERSSAWRENYPAIEWGNGVEGFRAEGQKQVKRYGASIASKPVPQPHVFCEACKGWLVLTPEEYNRQKAMPDICWVCPGCGALATDFAYRTP